jgi:NAD(P)-dependent dehydrogenase (short-subunit alcohol dehydrogenase family)
MRARKWGRIVNLASSTLGSVVSGFVHYVASKGGVVGFTRALATELGDDGITVNAISPGLTRSPGTVARNPRPGFASMEDEFAFAATMQAIKWPEVPGDLVGAVSFLTSDHAVFMTGQTLNIDGGRVRSSLYPRKRTLELSREMSALCQKRTLTGLFDDFVSRHQQTRRHC